MGVCKNCAQGLPQSINLNKPCQRKCIENLGKVVGEVREPLSCVVEGAVSHSRAAPLARPDPAEREAARAGEFIKRHDRVDIAFGDLGAFGPKRG